MPIFESERNFRFVAACPMCGHKLEAVLNDILLCTNCPRHFARQDGIWRFFSGEQQTQYRSFLNAYRQIRSQEGWKQHLPGYFLSLPAVADDDPAAWLWRMRQRSLHVLEGHLARRAGQWAVDLGAGNCWLSNYLGKRGYQVIAADIYDDDGDGLQGGRLYLDQGANFVRIQSSMEHQLPLQEQSMALCIINAAFHYVDPAATLANAYRILQYDGLLIVMDSPTFSSHRDGKLMMKEKKEFFRAHYHLLDIHSVGNGYLVRHEMMALMRKAGFQVSLRWPGGILRQQVHALHQNLRFGRQHAGFPLFICHKTRDQISPRFYSLSILP